MGLFINSHLQSLNLHKRLTELEKLSEITTGIMALKAMVEAGSDLSDRRMALDNLVRLMPMLTSTQQKFVIEEILNPLNADKPIDSDHSAMQQEDIDVDDFGEPLASSDYEMEFQLTLNRQAQMDIKELHRSQVQARKERNKEELEESRNRLRQQRREAAYNQLSQKLEKDWKQIQFNVPKRAIKQSLQRFLFLHRNELLREHPIILEARQRLIEVKRTLGK